MHAVSKGSFSCLNVCATAHAKAPKNLAFISKIVNKTFLLIADNLSVEEILNLIYRPINNLSYVKLETVKC